jgi:hypothetical protein
MKMMFLARVGLVSSIVAELASAEFTSLSLGNVSLHQSGKMRMSDLGFPRKLGAKVTP